MCLALPGDEDRLLVLFLDARRRQIPFSGRHSRGKNEMVNNFVQRGRHHQQGTCVRSLTTVSLSRQILRLLLCVLSMTGPDMVGRTKLNGCTHT